MGSHGNRTRVGVGFLQMANGDEGIPQTVYRLRVTVAAKVATMYEVRAATAEQAIAVTRANLDFDHDEWTVMEFEVDHVDVVVEDEATPGEVVWEPSKGS